MFVCMFSSWASVKKQKDSQPKMVLIIQRKTLRKGKYEICICEHRNVYCKGQLAELWLRVGPATCVFARVG